MNSSNRIKTVGSSLLLRQAHDTLRTLPKAVITAQERLRRRLRALVRVVLATAFLWLTTLFSIGIQITASVTAAKDASAKKRVKGQMKLRKVSNDSKRSSLLGIASWYGRGFHGRKTASGVVYDQNAMMAAHKTLPFGTILRVKNLANNRICYVEVTDRGPYIKGREIDLSRRAAMELGFINNGTARVQLDVVSEDIAEFYRFAPHPAAKQDVLRMPALASLAD